MTRGSAPAAAGTPKSKSKEPEGKGKSKAPEGRAAIVQGG
jgi:hypothetical protein